MSSDNSSAPKPDDAVPTAGPADAASEIETPDPPSHNLPSAEVQESNREAEGPPPEMDRPNSSSPPETDRPIPSSPPESRPVESTPEQMQSLAISHDAGDGQLTNAPSESPAEGSKAETPAANGGAKRGQDLPVPFIEGTYTAEGFFMPSYQLPPELDRIPSGSSVLDVESITGDFGRTYHGYKEGKYLFPNDGAEQDRLDFQHKALNVLLGDRLYLAPISSPEHVLDIATGTGIWPIEFAEIWPDSNIIGTDLSAIQPENAPPNCTFVKDDAEEPWVFPHTFDYIHLRLVFSCFSKPKKMMEEAFQWMNPGGWIEYQDPSIAQIGSMDDNIEGTSFQKWGLSLIEGIKSAQGRDIEVAPSYAQWLREAGFVDVEEKKLIWPAGPWAIGDPRMKLAGLYMQRNFLDGAFLATWKALRASGLSHEEAQHVIDEAKREIIDVKNRFYLVAYVVYGRKP